MSHARVSFKIVSGLLFWHQIQLNTAKGHRAFRTWKKILVVIHKIAAFHANASFFFIDTEPRFFIYDSVDQKSNRRNHLGASLSFFFFLIIIISAPSDTNN